MVEIRVDTDEILFRVIFAGREKATKFATLRALHESLSAEGAARMFVMHAGGDRVVGFELPIPDQERLFGMKVRMEVLARPGTRKSLANDVLLHRSADAIVWLDDRAPEDESARDDFEKMLEDLRRLGREARDLPLFVQCYDDADENRERLYRGVGGAWRPSLRVIGRDETDEVTVFGAVRKAVFQSYRRYEKELLREGLSDHVKIRDRIYERLPALPGNDSGNREIRLVRSQGRPRRRLELRQGPVVLGVALIAALAALIVASLI